MSAQANILYYEFENCTFKITVTSPRGQWVDTTRIDGLKQNCSNSIAKALELLQSCTYKPLRYLTHLPLDKMAAILADDNFKCIFSNENDRITIRMSLQLVPRSPIDNMPTLFQVMAWRSTGDKPLLESMQIQFTDIYMRHKGELNWWDIIKKIIRISYLC